MENPDLTFWISGEIFNGEYDLQILSNCSLDVFCIHIHWKFECESCLSFKCHMIMYHCIEFYNTPGGYLSCAIVHPLRINVLLCFCSFSEELLMSESVTRNNDTNITDISSKSELSEESKMNGTASPSKGLHTPTSKVSLHNVVIICCFVPLPHFLYSTATHFLLLRM